GFFLKRTWLQDNLALATLKLKKRRTNRERYALSILKEKGVVNWLFLLVAGYFDLKESWIFSKDSQKTCPTNYIEAILKRRNLFQARNLLYREKKLCIR
ncbi:MAG: hypothetical protein LBV23_00790, partial [Deltaproteobacteria bacterium]|nr:hypothetical protein [Deltaproteobacteria bacterium]